MISKIDSDMKKLLEMVSFAVISKVEYKANYYFQQFNVNTDIFENLPFNYKYLRAITKALIKVNFAFLKILDVFLRFREKIAG